MNTDITNQKPLKWLIFSLLLYVAAGSYLQFYHRYEGLNANTIGYLAVALEYANGNFGDAVNGFWPPLISWLIVPLYKAGITPLLAGRIVIFFSGFFLLIGIWKLSYQFIISEQIRNMVLLISVPVILSYSKIVFPDLMLLCVLVYYLNVVFDNDYPEHIRNGLLGGLLGAIAYFAKQYAFPFFLSHFILINIFHYLRDSSVERRKMVIRNALAGLIIFTIISGAWVAILSSKYGSFTITTVGKYNLAKVSSDAPAVPGFGDTEKGDIVYYAGLFKPVHETALSTWDDPTYATKKFSEDKKALGNLKHFAVHILKNVQTIIKMSTELFSILTFPVFIAYLIFCIRPVKKLLVRGDLLYPVITVLLYTSGYTLFIVYYDTVRYFWVDNILILLMGAHVLSVMFKSDFFNISLRKKVLIAIFSLSFILLPMKDVLSRKTVRGENNYNISRTLSHELIINGNIASNDRWGDTLSLTYYMNLHDGGPDGRTYYYGMPRQGQNLDEIINELNDHEIDYYLVWGGAEFVSSFEEISQDKLPNLKIYSLRK